MANSPPAVSNLTIGRLSLYRRYLNVLADEGVGRVFSHQLASMTGRSAAQVRRDLMAVGYTGSPARGYEVKALLASIREFLDYPGGQGAALVGVGNLGKSLLAYFTDRRPNLKIVVAFDTNPSKAHRVIYGIQCHSLEDLEKIVKARDIRVAIIAVPAPAAQGVADQLVAAGVRGLLNFAPARLRVPADVYVEDLDMTMSLEKVAYLARRDELVAARAAHAPRRPG